MHYERRKKSCGADRLGKKGHIEARRHAPRALQKRASGRNVREYAQLSYTFQKRSRTDYVQPEDLERIRSEIDNYRKFKDLCERLVSLSIEESKRKTEQRVKTSARSK